MTWYLAVLKNYTGFRGRARRREYWMFVLVNAIIGVALAGIGKLTHMPQTGTFGIGMSRNGLGVFGIGVFSNSILFEAYALATFLPFLAVEVRRLHDIGRTGWWWLLGLIPVLGWIVLVIFCATNGVAGDNRYGPDPKAPDPRPGAGHDDEAQRPDTQQRPRARRHRAHPDQPSPARQQYGSPRAPSRADGLTLRDRPSTGATRALPPNLRVR